jgi:hypothetical protein
MPKAYCLQPNAIKFMKLLKYIALASIGLTASSCESFLKENPDSIISEDQYYKTQTDAINAVNSVYFLLNAGGSSVQTPYNTLFNTGMNFAGDDEDPGYRSNQPRCTFIGGIGSLVIKPTCI